MNRTEFEIFCNPPVKENKQVFAGQLANKTPRTLLYGYDCDRNTLHVYFDGTRFVTLWYTPRLFIYADFGDVLLLESTIVIPNKRLYPETCDFELCKLIRDQGVHLPFTTYNSDREGRQFYGLLFDEIKALPREIIEYFHDPNGVMGGKPGAWRARLKSDPTIHDAGRDSEEAIAALLRLLVTFGKSGERKSYCTERRADEPDYSILAGLR